MLVPNGVFPKWFRTNTFDSLQHVFISLSFSMFACLIYLLVYSSSFAFSIFYLFLFMFFLLPPSPSHVTPLNNSFVNTFPIYRHLSRYILKLVFSFWTITFFSIAIKSSLHIRVWVFQAFNDNRAARFVFLSHGIKLQVPTEWLHLRTGALF